MNVAEVMVAGSIARLKIAETCALTATGLAPFAGIVETTVGGTEVVNVHVKFAVNATPLGSLAPVVIVAANKVPVARMVDGVKVATVPE